MRSSFKQGSFYKDVIPNQQGIVSDEQIRDLNLSEIEKIKTPYSHSGIEMEYGRFDSQAEIFFDMHED